MGVELAGGVAGELLGERAVAVVESGALGAGGWTARWTSERVRSAVGAVGEEAVAVVESPAPGAPGSTVRWTSEGA
jgi:hypothetical protein